MLIFIGKWLCNKIGGELSDEQQKELIALFNSTIEKYPDMNDEEKKQMRIIMIDQVKTTKVNEEKLAEFVEKVKNRMSAEKSGVVRSREENPLDRSAAKRQKLEEEKEEIKAPAPILPLGPAPIQTPQQRMSFIDSVKLAYI
jgi:hypothetical protein